MNEKQKGLLASSSSLSSSFPCKRRRKSKTSANHHHQCLFCERLFSSYASLETHMHSHTSEHPHLCFLCTCSFNSATSLHLHQQTAHLRVNAWARRRNSTTTILNSNLTDIVRRIILDKEEGEEERKIDNPPHGSNEHEPTEKGSTDANDLNAEHYNAKEDMEKGVSDVLESSKVNNCSENAQINANAIAKEGCEVDANMLLPSSSPPTPPPPLLVGRTNKTRKKVIKTGKNGIKTGKNGIKTEKNGIKTGKNGIKTGKNGAKTGKKVKQIWTCDICGSVFHRHDSYSLDRHKRTVHKDVISPQDRLLCSFPREKRSKVTNGSTESLNHLREKVIPGESGGLKIIIKKKKIRKGDGDWKRKKIWKCDICDKEFYRRDSYSLKRHQRTVHRNLLMPPSSKSPPLPRTVTASISNYQKTEHTSIDAHAQWETLYVDSKQLPVANKVENKNIVENCMGKCNICGKVLSRKDQYSMNRHKRNVHPDKMEGLERQKVKVEKREPSESTVVEYVKLCTTGAGNSRRTRKSDKKRFRGGGNDKNKGQSLIKFRNKWKKSVVAAGRSKHWKCVICSQFFYCRDRYSLNRHLRNVHHVNPQDLSAMSPAKPKQISNKKSLRVWKCEICGKVFYCKSRFNLTRHIRNVHSSHKLDSESSPSIMEELEGEQHTGSLLLVSLENNDVEDEEMKVEGFNEIKDQDVPISSNSSSLLQSTSDLSFLASIKLLHSLDEGKEAKDSSKTWDSSFFLHLNRYKPEDSCFSEVKTTASMMCSLNQKVSTSLSGMHSQEVMEFKCGKCGKRLSSGWSLKRHKRLPDCLAHKKVTQLLPDGSQPKNGLWSYWCMLCDKEFGHTRSNFARHIASMHRFGELQKPISGKSVGRKRDFPDYSCLFCDLRSKHRLILQHHLISNHLDRLIQFRHDKSIQNESKKEQCLKGQANDSTPEEIELGSRFLPGNVTQPTSPAVILEFEEEKGQREEHEERSSALLPVALVDVESDKDIGRESQVTFSDILSVSTSYQNSADKIITEVEIISPSELSSVFRNSSADQRESTLGQEAAHKIPPTSPPQLDVEAVVQSEISGNEIDEKEKELITCASQHLSWTLQREENKKINVLPERFTDHCSWECDHQDKAVQSEIEQLASRSLIPPPDKPSEKKCGEENFQPGVKCDVTCSSPSPNVQQKNRLAEKLLLPEEPLMNIEFKGPKKQVELEESWDGVTTNANPLNSPGSANFKCFRQVENESKNEKTRLGTYVQSVVVVPTVPDKHGQNHKEENKRVLGDGQVQVEQVNDLVSILVQSKRVITTNVQSYCQPYEEDDNKKFGERIEQSHVSSSLLLTAHVEGEAATQKVSSSTNLSSLEKDKEHYPLDQSEDEIQAFYYSASPCSAEQDFRLEKGDGGHEEHDSVTHLPLLSNYAGESEQDKLYSVRNSSRSDIPSVHCLPVGETESANSESPEYSELEFIPDSPRFAEYEPVESDNELEGSNVDQITFLPPASAQFRDNVLPLISLQTQKPCFEATLFSKSTPEAKSILQSPSEVTLEYNLSLTSQETGTARSPSSEIKLEDSSPCSTSTYVGQVTECQVGNHGENNGDRPLLPSEFQATEPILSSPKHYSTIADATFVVESNGEEENFKGAQSIPLPKFQVMASTISLPSSEIQERAYLRPVEAHVTVSDCVTQKDLENGDNQFAFFRELQTSSDTKANELCSVYSDAILVKERKNKMYLENEVEKHEHYLPELSLQFHTVMSTLSPSPKIPLQEPISTRLEVKVTDEHLSNLQATVSALSPVPSRPEFESVPPSNDEQVENQSIEQIDLYTPQHEQTLCQKQHNKEMVETEESLQMSFSPSSSCKTLKVGSSKGVTSVAHKAKETEDSVCSPLQEAEYVSKGDPSSSTTNSCRFRYKCKKCTKHFVHKSDFKRHRNCQADKLVKSSLAPLRWYPCPHCKRDFKDKRSNLVRHLVGIHCCVPQDTNDSSKKKPKLERFRKFSCVFCGRKCKERERMKEHILSEHLEILEGRETVVKDIIKEDSPPRISLNRTNFCDKMNMTTTSIEPLRTYPLKKRKTLTMNVQGERWKSWMCDICGKSFYRTNSYSLDRHKRSVHKDMLPTHGKNMGNSTTNDDKNENMQMDTQEGKGEAVDLVFNRKESTPNFTTVTDAYDVVEKITEEFGNPAHAARKNIAVCKNGSAKVSHSYPSQLKRKRRVKKLTLTREKMKIWMCDICGKVFYRPNSYSLNRHRKNVHKHNLVQDSSQQPNLILPTSKEEQLEVGEVPPPLFKATCWVAEDDENRVMPLLTPVVILAAGCEGDGTNELTELPPTVPWLHSKSVDGWVCRKCGKAFKRRSDLFRHQTQPTDCLVLKEMREYSIWYWCSFCHRDFGKRRYDLIRHIISKHCSISTNVTTSSERTDEPGVLSCGFCTELDGSSKVLYNHILRHHLDKIQVKQRRIPRNRGMNTEVR